MLTVHLECVLKPQTGTYISRASPNPCSWDHSIFKYLWDLKSCELWLLIKPSLTAQLNTIQEILRNSWNRWDSVTIRNHPVMNVVIATDLGCHVVIISNPLVDAMQSIIKLSHHSWDLLVWLAFEFEIATDPSIFTGHSQQTIFIENSTLKPCKFAGYIVQSALFTVFLGVAWG